MSIPKILSSSQHLYSPSKVSNATKNETSLALNRRECIDQIDSNFDVRVNCKDLNSIESIRCNDLNFNCEGFKSNPYNLENILSCKYENINDIEQPQYNKIHASFNSSICKKLNSASLHQEVHSSKASNNVNLQSFKRLHQSGKRKKYLSTLFSKDRAKLRLLQENAFHGNSPMKLERSTLIQDTNVIQDTKSSYSKNIDERLDIYLSEFSSEKSLSVCPVLKLLNSPKRKREFVSFDISALKNPTQKKKIEEREIRFWGDGIEVTESIIKLYPA